MMNYLKPYYIPITIIRFIIFNLLFKQIYSISGTSSERYSPDSPDVSSNDETICPCDITEGVCDVGCCCDKDCLDLMLSNKFFDEFQCDDSSYTENNIDSKLDYCDDYLESVDDLYNPLVLAFKILKRGFCIVKKQDRKEDEGNTDDYDKLCEEYESKSNSDNSGNEDNNKFEKVYLEENELNNLDRVLDDNINFKPLNISLPIALPNGMCLFHSYNLKKNIDYEITCNYNKSLNSSIITDELLNYKPINVKNYYIHDYYYDENRISGENYYIKKVEIIYYNNRSNDGNCSSINYFYEANNDNNNAYMDLTFEVKFLFDDNDFKLSGNPGYIKGKPIIFSTNDSIIEGVFPLEKSDKMEFNTNGIDQYIFFDNYFDNKITFEDLIIYGYSQTNLENSKKILGELFGENNYNFFGYTNLGNGKNRNPFSKKYNPNNNFVMIGEYKDINTVNNTQFKIYSLVFNEESESGVVIINKQTSYRYFIVKLVKLETDTKWWYAPGPVIIKLPKNIMYPFKIGTSKYKR